MAEKRSPYKTKNSKLKPFLEHPLKRRILIALVSRHRSDWFDGFARLAMCNRNMRFYFCTLKCEHYSRDELGLGIKRLKKYWDKFVKSDVFRFCKGYIRFLDCNANGDFPHYHALLALPSHTETTNIISKNDWAKAWNNATSGQGSCYVKPLYMELFDEEYLLNSKLILPYLSCYFVANALAMSSNYGCKYHGKMKPLENIPINEKRYKYGIFADYLSKNGKYAYIDDSMIQRLKRPKRGRKPSAKKSVLANYIERSGKRYRLPKKLNLE